jgi:hypothetical protein
MHQAEFILVMFTKLEYVTIVQNSAELSAQQQQILQLLLIKSFSPYKNVTDVPVITR